MATILPEESVTIHAGYHYLSSTNGHYDFGPPIGELLFQGRPFGPGNTDTIYRRLEDAVLPRLGSSATVPIEMVKVGLESIQPLSIEGRLYDVSIYLTPGKRSTGEMRIVMHAPDDGTSGSHGTYDTNVAIFFTAEMSPQDGKSEPIKREADIFIQSTAHGRWSLNPAARSVFVLQPQELPTTNFFVVGTTPMLDVALMAGGANTGATF
jgi:hypothetical protein